MQIYQYSETENLTQIEELSPIVIIELYLTYTCTTVQSRYIIKNEVTKGLKMSWDKKIILIKLLSDYLGYTIISNSRWTKIMIELNYVFKCDEY